MLIVGNKIKMIKAIGGLDKVGDEFEVTNISEEGTITIRSSYGIGVMNYKEFEEHFEIVKEVVWTQWSDIGYLSNEFDNLGVIHRTNNVDTVEVYGGLGLETVAKLHPDDTFDFEKGLSIAMLRMKKLILDRKLKELIE